MQNIQKESFKSIHSPTANPSVPSFSLRPLWIGDQLQNALLDHLSNKNAGSFEGFCIRAFELGYNAIMFGSHHPSRRRVFQTLKPQLENAARLLHAHRLQLILKLEIEMERPSQRFLFAPMNNCFRIQTQKSINEVLQAVPSLDYLFYESCCSHSDFLKDPLSDPFTRTELVQEEIHFIENALPSHLKLIFFVPFLESPVEHYGALKLKDLWDAIEAKTILAFSAVKGFYYQSYLAPHPFWTQLRDADERIMAPLMPIINIGGIDQGEGLWPSIAFELFDNYFARCYRHHFAGVLCLTNQISAAGGFLECNLWTASQMMQAGKSAPDPMIESWFLLRMPEIDYSGVRDILKEVRSITLEISKLRSMSLTGNLQELSMEEWRTCMETLLMRLRIFSFHTARTLKIGKPIASFSDYLEYFARDAKRMMIHAARSLQIALPVMAMEDDLQDSFWTKAIPGGEGGRHGVKVSINDQPQSGLPSTAMHHIYSKTFLH